MFHEPYSVTKRTYSKWKSLSNLISCILASVKWCFTDIFVWVLSLCSCLKPFLLCQRCFRGQNANLDLIFSCYSSSSPCCSFHHSWCRVLWSALKRVVVILWETRRHVSNSSSRSQCPAVGRDSGESRRQKDTLTRCYSLIAAYGYCSEEVTWPHYSATQVPIHRNQTAWHLPKGG